MNGFDLALLRFTTSLANRSPVFDALVSHLSSDDLAKGGLAMALFWAAWFLPGKEQERRRKVLLATLAGSAVALVGAATLATVLPFRLRPMLALQPPGTASPANWDQWSAFPSDHAALFFGLATGLLRAARPIGGLAVAHAVVLVALPRIYLGLHYPTDILAGAALGVASVYLTTRWGAVLKLASIPLSWERRRPQLFYPVAFLVSYSIATLFYDLRVMTNGVLQVLGLR